jgi:hypothetical protein
VLPAATDDIVCTRRPALFGRASACRPANLVHRMACMSPLCWSAVCWSALYGEICTSRPLGFRERVVREYRVGAARLLSEYCGRMSWRLGLRSCMLLREALPRLRRIFGDIQASRKHGEPALGWLLPRDAFPRNVQRARRARFASPGMRLPSICRSR